LLLLLLPTNDKRLADVDEIRFELPRPPSTSFDLDLQLDLDSNDMTTPLRMADSNIPIVHAPAAATKRRPILSSTPFSAPLRTTTEIDADLSSFSLETTLAHLVEFLVHKLEAIYPPHLVQTLRRSIVSHLTPKLAPTWDPLNPSSGSGVRSLIALPGKFPTPLVKAAIEVGIDPVKWTRAISETGEWEIWVDPGSVCFREGGWAFADEAFENKTYKREWSCGSGRLCVLPRDAEHLVRSGLTRHGSSFDS
jgi:hypothetical protein